MNARKDKGGAVRLSLLDVIYGVVFAYGFQFVDQADTSLGFIRFFFAYAILTIDWVYVHQIYWGWEYKYNTFLLLDLGILFSLSRMLYTSTAATQQQLLLWLSLLFLLYVLWDVIPEIKRLKIERLPTPYDRRFGLAGDAFATASFLSLYLLLQTRVLEPALSTHLLMIVVYFIAVSTWFKKAVHRG